MAFGSPNLTLSLSSENCAPIVEAKEGLGNQRVLLWDTKLQVGAKHLRAQCPKKDGEGGGGNQGRCWGGPSHESSNAKIAPQRGEEGGRLRGLAYPFGLGAHGWVVGVVGRSIRKVDLHIIRHVFQEVGRHEAFLPTQFYLETKCGGRVKGATSFFQSLLLP